MVYTITRGSVEEGCEKKGSAWKGVLLSFLASLPFFTHGLETLELSSTAHSGHFTPTSEEVPWNGTALVVAAGLSAPVYCYVIDRYGRKVGLFLVSLVQGASCIPLFLPRDFTDDIILHAVAGVASGGLFTVLPTYIREVSSPSTEGFSLCLVMAMTSGGYLMKLALDYEELMYVLVAMVVVQLLSMLAMVESPSYYVIRGRCEAAKKALAKLKGLEENNLNLIKEVDSLKNESERAKSKGKLSLIQIFRSPIYRDATKIGVILHTALALCGSVVFLDEEKALRQLRTTVDPDRTLVLASLSAGGVVTLLLVKFVEKKYITTLSFFLMVVSMGVLAVYTQTELAVTSLRWVPPSALAALVFAYGLAWAMPSVVMVEIYNFEIRAKMTGLLFFYSQVIKLVHIHTYQYIEDYMGIYTVLYIFTFVNLYGGVYALFAIPDLRDKTNKQIERQLKRVPLLKFNTKSLPVTK